MVDWMNKGLEKSRNFLLASDLIDMTPVISEGKSGKSGDARAMSTSPLPKRMTSHHQPLSLLLRPCLSTLCTHFYFQHQHGNYAIQLPLPLQQGIELHPLHYPLPRQCQPPKNVD